MRSMMHFMIDEGEIACRFRSQRFFERHVGSCNCLAVVSWNYFLTIFFILFYLLYQLDKITHTDMHSTGPGWIISLLPQILNALNSHFAFP